MRDLQEIREEIDQINRQLVPLLERRMNAVLDVARYKKVHGLPVRDLSRENDVLEKCAALLKDPRYDSHVREIFRTIMAQSCRAEEQFLEEK